MSTHYRRFAGPTITLRLGGFRWVVATSTVLLAIILFFGAVFRFAALDRWSLWTDEFHTIDMADEIDNLHEQGPPDQHPPLYHLITSRLTVVSIDETWLRLPSALSGFLAIVLVWKTGVALAGRRLGLMAAALAAFSPLLIWYAREARMYGVATGFWAASVYFYVQSFRRDRWVDTLGLAASTLGALLLTYSSLGLWLGELSLVTVFWYLSGRRRPRLSRWLLAQAAVAAGFATWLPFMQVQFRRSMSFNWQLPFADLSASLSQVLQAGILAGLTLLILSTLLSLAVMTRLSLLRLVRRQAPLAATALTLFYLVVLILGTIPRGLSIRRQLLVFILPLLVAAAWGVVTLRLRWLPLTVVVLAFGLSSYTFLSKPYQDWRGAAIYLAEQTEQSDIIFVYPGWRQTALEYYDPGGLANRRFASESTWPPGEPIPFSAGTDVWVIVHNHPTAAADVAHLWARFDGAGELIVRAHFPSYIELRRYRIR